MLSFLCYPKCGTCRKARAWLDAAGIEYQVRDISSHRPTQEELTEWYRLSGRPLRRFFNTSGQLYRSMDLKNRLPDLSDEEMLELLASDGMLVRRPILSGEDFVLVGFREAEWEAQLK